MQIRKQCLQTDARITNIWNLFYWKTIPIYGVVAKAINRTVFLLGKRED